MRNQKHRWKSRSTWVMGMCVLAMMMATATTAQAITIGTCDNALPAAEPMIIVVVSEVTPTATATQTAMIEECLLEVTIIITSTTIPEGNYVWARALNPSARTRVLKMPNEMAVSSCCPHTSVTALPRPPLIHRPSMTVDGWFRDGGARKEKIGTTNHTEPKMATLVKTHDLAVVPRAAPRKAIKGAPEFAVLARSNAVERTTMAMTTSNHTESETRLHLMGPTVWVRAPMILRA